MQESTSVDRRTVIRGVGSLALVGSLAGCTTDGNGGDGGNGDGFSPPQEALDYLEDVPNYESFEDLTGQSSVTVDVGGEPNNNWSFVPPAVRISTGTTVVWEWTGDGSSHNVVDEGGGFESEITDEAGATFEETFDSTGVVRYFCMPHKSAGMKGVIVVE